MDSVPGKIYIHIGAPKTGSTALQYFLQENRELLKERLALYPGKASRAGGHHDIAFLLDGGYPHWATPQEKDFPTLWRELEEEAESHGGNVLISSENFYLFPRPDRLAELLSSSRILGHMQPNILIYLRQQEDIVEAWYNQTVKAQGFCGGIGESLERDGELWDYRARLAPWARAFREENILVRIYRGGTGREWDIRGDFLDAFGLETQGFSFPPGRTNTNLNRDILEFQRIMNRLPLTAKEKRRFHKQLIELTEKTRGTGVFSEGPLLSGAQRREIRSRYRDSNRETARTYLGRDELFPGEPQPSEDKPPYEGLSPETATALLGWVLLKK